VYSLDSKIVFITGGTGKVGRILVRSFLSLDYIVITTSRKKANLNELKEGMKEDEISRFYGVTLNLEEGDAIKKLIAWFDKNNLFPSVLINNARNMDYLLIQDGAISKENWLGEFYVDVVIPYELSMGLANHSRSKLEKIINISSMYGVVAANPNLYDDFSNQSPINYGVSKAALIHLTKELAIRLAKKKIDVNTVSYGGIEGRVNEEFLKKYSELSPQGKMLSDNDVVGSVQFLASKASVGMTGQNLIVDGGWTTW